MSGPPAAEAEGYEGGLAMSFLRLGELVLPPAGTHPPVPGIGPLGGGINQALPAQEGSLLTLLPIP